MVRCQHWNKNAYLRVWASPPFGTHALKYALGGEISQNKNCLEAKDAFTSIKTCVRIFAFQTVPVTDFTPIYWRIVSGVRYLVAVILRGGSRLDDNER